MEYKIEKDVPIVSKKTGKTKYPFAEMEIKDSFYVEPDIAINARGAAYQYARQNVGKEFTVRKAGPGFRIWRTK